MPRARDPLRGLGDGRSVPVRVPGLGLAPEPEVWPDGHRTWPRGAGAMIALPTVHPARYRRGRGPRALRQRYWCPRGCVAARYATRLHRLPWRFFVTLTAPRGKFPEALESARVDDWWSGLGDPAHPELQPFWLMTLVSHELCRPVSPTEVRVGSVRYAAVRPVESRAKWWQAVRDDVHMHLLLGNVSRADVDRMLARWPDGYQVDCQPITRERGGPWGVLHYVVSQSEPRSPGVPSKRRHRAEVPPRPTVVVDDKGRPVLDDEGRPEFKFKGPFLQSALLCPPLESDNLDLITEAVHAQLRRQRARVFAEAGARGAQGRGPQWCHDRAQKAANARWSKWRSQKLGMKVVGP